MKLQRILAKDSRTANEQAIAQYGRDVLVVSNSRVNGMTELIVAVDVEPEKMPPPMMPKGGGEAFEAAMRQQRLPAADMQDESEQAASPAAGGFMPAHMALMQAAQRAAAQTMAATEVPRETTRAPQVPARAAAAPSPAAAVSAPAPSLSFSQQLKAPTVRWSTRSLLGLSGQSPLQPAASAATEDLGQAPAAAETPIAAATRELSGDQARAVAELVRSEIAALRKEMRMNQQLQAWAAQGPAHRWNEALSEVGVPTALRALLMSGLSNDYDDHEALEAIEAQMTENLPRSSGAARSRSHQPGKPWTSGVHLLSGPSGGGKTAMTARLAHEAAQRLGVERVVLISWNDSRPGAWGQLQLWASRIGVPAFRAADSATLELLMQEHRGQLVIVDGGLSQPDILGEATKGLSLTHHLVMPADANTATLRRWIGEHAPAWHDVLVTRLDESAEPWPLLHACCEHGLQPAAASEGSGLQHLRQPYDALALLQHAMGLLGMALGTHTGEGRCAGPSALDIPTIEHITTTVPPRQAGRSGRSQAAKVEAATGRASTRTRPGATHA